MWLALTSTSLQIRRRGQSENPVGEGDDAKLPEQLLDEDIEAPAMEMITRSAEWARSLQREVEKALGRAVLGPFDLLVYTHSLTARVTGYFSDPS